MRPTEIASVLGLDLTTAIAAVPLLDGEFRDISEITGSVEAGPIPGQRLRQVVM